MIRVAEMFLEMFSDSGLKQSEFAERLGIPQARLNVMLNGKSRPSMNELERICESLGCDIQDVIERAEG